MTTPLDATALAAILARPLDDAPRLALAATLKERGDPRGVFIEAQVRLAQRGVGRAERGAHTRESQRLLGANGSAWSASASGLRHRMHRGFVDHVVASAQDLIARAGELFAREPITNLTVTAASADLLPPLVAQGAFAHVDRLTLRGVLGDDGAKVLAGALAKRTLPLGLLNVGGTHIESEGAASLAASLEGCRALALTGNAIGDDGLAALGKSKKLASLSTLFLTDNDLTDDGVAAFAKSAALGSLLRLGLARNDDVTSSSLAALAKSKKLKRLRWLEYSDEDGIQRVAVRTSR